MPIGKTTGKRLAAQCDPTKITVSKSIPPPPEIVKSFYTHFTKFGNLLNFICLGPWKGVLSKIGAGAPQRKGFRFQGGGSFRLP